MYRITINRNWWFFPYSSAKDLAVAKTSITNPFVGWQHCFYYWNPLFICFIFLTSNFLTNSSCHQLTLAILASVSSTGKESSSGIPNAKLLIFGYHRVPYICGLETLLLILNTYVSLLTWLTGISLSNIEFLKLTIAAIN